MKSKLLLVMLILMTCLLSQRGNAQTRYQDSVFASYTLDSVTYSSVTGFKMDIYQPAGDVAATRPVVMLIHGGTFVSGTRSTDTTVVRLCRDLAHRGYVTVSIDYTLAYPITNMLDSTLAALEVFKSIADARAAVRFLYEDAQTTNTYKIDTNNIFIGGNSAGGVLAMHYAYVISTSQFNGEQIFLSAVDSIGGTLEGNHGNPGYSSRVKGVISLSGGLNQAGWMTQCGVPMVGAHGSADVVVPYTCADPFVFGIAHVPLQLCGLGSYSYYLTNNVPFSETLTFPGAGHVPWDTNAVMYAAVDTLVSGFLYKEVAGLAPTVCTGFPAGIQNIASGVTIALYPNPATNVLNVRSSDFISAITVIDEMGRVVNQVNDLHDMDYQLNTSRLSSGIYFVKIDNGSGQNSTVRKVTIE
jgi:pimeloyl-ACP methyl ester carboxylesterase